MHRKYYNIFPFRFSFLRRRRWRQQCRRAVGWSDKNIIIFSGSRLVRFRFSFLIIDLYIDICIVILYVYTVIGIVILYIYTVIDTVYHTAPRLARRTSAAFYLALARHGGGGGGVYSGLSAETPL